ncbi:hypothetical protein ACVRZR_06695 [Streptococcus entericus]|uniref:hypothetical protein n=1 Tax=Streptococcus entericus TaxID=155680 RepID=UPI00037CAB24|nr:hypothetical protein [Streptococcus entericus]
MKKIDKISFLVLLDEVGEVRQLLENLVGMNKDITSSISTGVLPFISSLSDGILHFLPEDSLEEFPYIGKQDLKKIIASVRVSYKQYSDKKFNKAVRKMLSLQEIFYSELTKGYNFFQKMLINNFGQPDLGVYYFKGIPYANTNQYYIYVESILSKTDSKDIPLFSNQAENLFFEYSKNLATLINSTNLKVIKDAPNQNIDSTDFELKDFYFLDQKRRNILIGKFPLEAQLFLFNILCQNNFILYILPILLNSKNSFFTRSLMQSYIVSIKVLRLVYEKYSSSLSKSQQDTFVKIIENKELALNIGNSFRNNIFHYQISDVPAEYLVKQEKYFEGLIGFYSEKNFKEYQELLIQSTVEVNQLIKSLIE